jgi:hypothetical protein
LNLTINTSSYLIAYVLMKFISISILISCILPYKSFNMFGLVIKLKISILCMCVVVRLTDPRSSHPKVRCDVRDMHQRARSVAYVCHETII